MFFDFVELLRANGEQIAQSILSSLTANNIDIKKCRWQAYDGASAMSSNKVGVQSRVKEVSPLALYTHCMKAQGLLHSLKSGQQIISFLVANNSVELVKPLATKLQKDTGSVHPTVKSVKIFEYTSLSASMGQLAIFFGKHIFLVFP